MEAFGYYKISQESLDDHAIHSFQVSQRKRELLDGIELFTGGSEIKKSYVLHRHIATREMARLAAD
jgi:hypothetical protein